MIHKIYEKALRKHDGGRLCLKSLKVGRSSTFSFTPGFSPVIEPPVTDQGTVSTVSQSRPSVTAPCSKPGGLGKEDKTVETVSRIFIPPPITGLKPGLN